MISEQEIKKILQDKLKDTQKLAILGIGSDLKGDDQAGMLAAEAIEYSLKGKISPQRIKVFYGLDSPENITGEIRRFGPKLILIIDAAVMGQEPGDIALIREEQIRSGAVSTHGMPLNMLIEYLRFSFGCEIIVIGIQPKQLELNSPASEEIKVAASRLARIISEAAGI